MLTRTLSSTRDSGQWAVRGVRFEGIKMPVRNYRELIAWQKAMELVKLIYRSTKAFPRDEQFGLTSQIRRAVVSIPSNIAEGQGRRSTKDFLRHLSIAYGSLREVETQILIAEMLEYLSAEEVNSVMDKCGEVGRLVNGLVNSLEPRLETPSAHRPPPAAHL